MLSVGVNGLGRIGRLFLRKAGGRFHIEAVNSPGSIESAAHLLKYDTVHGVLKEDVQILSDNIQIGGQKFRYSREKDPAKIDWSGVDLVLESSGVFKTKEDLSLHLKNSVKKVLVAAPAKGADWTAVYGVNHKDYAPSKHHLISAASCTTNCLAPMALVMDQTFGIERGYMTTVHSYTNDQKLLDSAHKDLRRARSAALSMVPTTTGAVGAIGQILPSLKGRLKGFSIRVPTANVSLLELVLFCKKTCSKDLILKSFLEFEKKSSILAIEKNPLVSSDFIGSPFSAVIDADLVQAEGNTAQLFAWYDNEAGYCHRLMDLIEAIEKKGL